MRVARIGGLCEGGAGTIGCGSFARGVRSGPPPVGMWCSVGGMSGSEIRERAGARAGRFAAYIALLLAGACLGGLAVSWLGRPATSGVEAKKGQLGARGVPGLLLPPVHFVVPGLISEIVLSDRGAARTAAALSLSGALRDRRCVARSLAL